MSDVTDHDEVAKIFLPDQHFVALAALSESLIQMARILASYRKELAAQGFEDDMVNSLVLEMQRLMVTSSSGRG